MRTRDDGPLAPIQVQQVAAKQHAALQSALSPPVDGQAPKDSTSSLTMDDLNPVEQAAATLGVDPDGIKPISWLNEAHYNELKKSNALDSNLGRRIEAYKHLSEQSSTSATASLVMASTA